MKYAVVLLLLGIIVVVSSIPVEKEVSVQQSAVAPHDDSAKTASKDELEGAESAYLGFPYYYPYIYKYPVIVYGK